MTYDISQFSSESSITDNMDDYKSKILQSASRMPSLERLFLGNLMSMNSTSEDCQFFDMQICIAWMAGIINSNKL